MGIEYARTGVKRTHDDAVCDVPVAVTSSMARRARRVPYAASNQSIHCLRTNTAGVLAPSLLRA
jgi:hypothetical protein